MCNCLHTQTHSNLSQLQHFLQKFLFLNTLHSPTIAAIQLGNPCLEKKCIPNITTKAEKSIWLTHKNYKVQQRYYTSTKSYCNNRFVNTSQQYHKRYSMPYVNLSAIVKVKKLRIEITMIKKEICILLKSTNCPTSQSNNFQNYSWTQNLLPVFMYSVSHRK